ncbi:MAG: VOC family protein [Gammaproteobacteria bacterium]
MASAPVAKTARACRSVSASRRYASTASPWAAPACKRPRHERLDSSSRPHRDRPRPFHAVLRPSVAAAGVSPHRRCRRGPAVGGYERRNRFAAGTPGILAQARPLRTGLHHLALGAPSREAVDAAYRVLLAQGVDILDPPAQYDHYTPGYYALFFADPDGLKLEYVYTPRWPA